MIRKLLTPLLFALAVFIGWQSACAQVSRPNGYVDMQRPVNWDCPLNRGLVSWWAILPDTNRGSVTLRDLCGRNHGTLTNMEPDSDWVTSTYPGQYGGLYTDGTNEYITATLPGTDVIGSWTFEAVVSWGSGRIFRVGTAGTQTMFLYNGTNLYYETSSGSTNSAFSTSSLIGAGWKHLVLRHDASGNVNLWIDGKKDATTLTRTVNSFSPTSVTFGKELSTYGISTWSMAKWYSVAKSDSEILSLAMDARTGYPQTLNWIDYEGEYYEDAAPGGVGTPYYYQTNRQRDREKFYAAIGLPTETHWSLSP